MIINHNITELNTHNKLSSASSAQSKSMEKLASGLRINRAGDDAAGLAISEKMRAQVRGLDQASRNSQDGISMIQTAEGALNETHDILQRMRELATQAANDTNVGVDRGEIQKEINQLSSEINRVGNTTEFNTQSLLKGDGKANLAETGKTTNANLTGGTTTTTQASQLVTLTGAATNGQTAEFTLNGQKITFTFATNPGGTGTENTLDGASTDVTKNSAKIYLNNAGAGTPVADSATTAATAITAALKEVIAKNDDLKGNYTVSNTGGAITVSATSTGLYAGANGNIAVSGGTVAGATSGTASVGVTTEVKATAANVVDFTSATSAANAQKFVGTGFTVGDKQVEFYNADKGPYTGNAVAVNISGVSTAAGMIQAVIDQAGPQIKDVTFSTGAAGKLSVTAALGGKSGNDIRVTDGGVQEKFTASFQVGANKGQSMTIEIADMRSDALGITGKSGEQGFTATNVVTDGTSSITKEAALDVSNHTSASAAVKVINDAIEKVSSQRSNLGAFQNRLEHTINNLKTSSENLTAAESRVRDVDMAKEMMNQTKNSILAQAAQAMLAQSNQTPQGVLQLLR